MERGGISSETDGEADRQTGRHSQTDEVTDRQTLTGRRGQCLVSGRTLRTESDMFCTRVFRCGSGALWTYDGKVC